MTHSQKLLFNLLASLERSTRVTFSWMFKDTDVKTISFNESVPTFSDAGVTVFPPTLYFDNETMFPIDTNTFCDNEGNLYNFSYLLIKEVTVCKERYVGPNLDPFNMFKELAVESGFNDNQELLVWFLDSYSSMLEKCELADNNNLIVH